MFSWWKKRREVKNAPKFMGVNLDKNHYLGYTNIKYVNTDGKTTRQCNIHFFVDKEDHTIRVYKFECENESDFYYHPWMTQARLWMLNEKELWYSIKTMPSKWLNQYMIDNYDSIWSEEKEWWEHNTKSKIESKEDNVIKVTF